MVTTSGAAHTDSTRGGLGGSRRRTRSARILLLCSTFNGLSQRAWVELRDAGHEVEIQLAGDPGAVVARVASLDPDLVICPFLRERVPEEVWSSWPTIIVHPGPEGDRGPSSLDWALMAAEPEWGVTALQAVEEMDAGPIWGSRTFAVDALRKSDLYNGPVTEAALELIHEVVAKAATGSFDPTPLAWRSPRPRGRLRPAVRRTDRSFSWSDPRAHILRKIRAADGSPGVRTELSGMPVAVFDAHDAGPPSEPHAAPGTVTRRRHGAVQVATGDGAIWVGHLRSLVDPASPGVKLPATTVLEGCLDNVPHAPDGAADHREIAYHRSGSLGVLSVDFYSGAMSTAQCRRLDAALGDAISQDTRVLLLRGGATFSNGIHLGVIEAADDPAAEAWDNIVAIDDVCRRIITCTDQLVVCSIGGNAGAGGVMLALGADQVLMRRGTVLNSHYRTMGLYGSEYWTYVLPRRVGPEVAHALTTRCDPVGAAEALSCGLVDRVMSAGRSAFEAEATRHAQRLADSTCYPRLLAEKRETRAEDESRRPLEDHRRVELENMWADIIHDEHGFADARRRFIRPGAAKALLRREPAT